jgi:hypothetical protein
MEIVMADNFHAIDEPDLAKDMVIGAENIAVWLFGSRERTRSVYHLFGKTNFGKTKMPSTEVGGRLAIRKSVIRGFLWARERRAFRDHKGEYSNKVEQLVRLGILLPKLVALLEAEANGASHGRIDPDHLRLWILIVRETLRAAEGVLKGE